MHSRIEPPGCGRMRVLRRGIVWGIVVLLVGLLFVGGASAYRSNVTEDSYTFNQNSSGNYGNAEPIIVRGSSQTNNYIRGFFKFEDSDTIINQVYFNFYNTNDVGSPTIRIFKVTENWGESTITWTNMPTNVDTYYQMSPSNGWNNVSINFSTYDYGVGMYISAYNEQISVNSRDSAYIPYIIYSYVEPQIISWSNTKTNNNTLNFTVSTIDSIVFNITADQTITTWNWFKNDINQNNNYDNFTTSFTEGNHTIKVNATNANGISNTVAWNIESKITTSTISCPIGWCYLASNYSSMTLLELDNLFSTDTVQGHYNATSQKYESHRTGYNFNQNVSVVQKEGYYYYFSTATDITTTPGSTPSITLKTGWNLVGNYGSSARTLAALKSSIGSSATQAQYYNKTLKTWVSTDNQSVPAMEGFFVYVTSQTDWSG